MTTPATAELETARLALRDVLEDYLKRIGAIGARQGAHVLSRAVVCGVEGGELLSAKIVDDITAALREELGR